MTALEQLVSQSQRFRVLMQNDGNLVVYDNATDLPVWDAASGLYRPPDLSLPWPPAPPEPPTPPVSDLRLLRANFCNIPDSTGRPIFSSCLATQTPATQTDWIARERAAGGTHYVFSIESGYPGYSDVVNFYTAGRMSEWLETLDRVVLAGLVPVVFLSSGNVYPGQLYFRGLLQSIPASYHLQVVWACGWECVKGGWSSAQYLRGNLAIREALSPGALMASHLSPGRLSFSSNPGEADDPWRRWWWQEGTEWVAGEGLGDAAEADKQAHPVGEWRGDEMACWRDGWGIAGHPFSVFLYQSPVPREPIDVTKPESWGERAKEVADRALGLPGAPDWFAGLKRPSLNWFEATAYDYIRAQSTSEWAREVARSVVPLGYEGFGNGLP